MNRKQTIENPRPIPVDREKLLAAAKSLGQQAHHTIEHEDRLFAKGWVLGHYHIETTDVAGNPHRIGIWLVTRPTRGWFDGITGLFSRNTDRIMIEVPVDEFKDYDMLLQHTGSSDWGEVNLMGTLLHEFTHARDVYAQTESAKQSLMRKRRDTPEQDEDAEKKAARDKAWRVSYLNQPIEVRARMQELSDLAVRSIPEIMRTYRKANRPPIPATQWVLEQMSLWQEIEPDLTPASKKKIMLGVERTLRDAGLKDIEVTSDIEDAVEYYVTSFITEPDGRICFEASQKTMPLQNILQWDDYSSWGEIKPGDLVGMSKEEIASELKSYRGAEWAKMAMQWVESGVFPPITLVSGKASSAMADGRGRVNIAVGLNLKSMDVIILTESDKGAMCFEYEDWTIRKGHSRKKAASRNPARKLPVSELLPVKVIEGGKVFETGQPVTIRYLHNTEKSGYHGSRYQQDIEPAGMYVNHLFWELVDPPSNWEVGEVHLQSPLVLRFTTDGPDVGTLYGPGSWKARLHAAFKAKGCALTKALRRAGYDSIVTVMDSGPSASHTGEIVFLPEDCKPRRPRKNPAVKPPTALVGHDPTGRHDRVAPVNWNAMDLPILAPWTEESVREWTNAPKDAVIYRSIIDLDELDENLAEEESGDEEDAGGYDWSELQQSRRTAPPPILVMRRAKDNALVVMDGNHRVRFWKDSNYERAPAWVYDEALTKYAKRSKKKIRVLQGEESEENPTRRNPSHDAWTSVGDATSALVIVHPSALGEYSRKVGGSKARDLATRITDKIVSWRGSVVLLENVPYLKDREAAPIAKPVLEAAEAKGATTIVHDITGDDDFDVVLPVLKKLRAQGVNRVLLGGIWASEDFETGCVSACRDVLLSGRWWTEVDFSISGMESD